MRLKINEIVGINESPAARAAELRKKFAAAGMADIMDVGVPGGIDPVELGMMRAASQPQLYERDELSVPEAPVTPVGTWTVDAMTAKSKVTGKDIAFWQVRDGRSGIKMPHSFRLIETADRVKAILNRTGNVNDPRISQWIDIDKKRNGLVSQIRTLKEAINAGNRGAVAQLNEAKEELLVVDSKIGI